MIAYVLESGWRRGKLVAERIILHVDSHEIVQPRGGKGQYPRNLPKHMISARCGTTNEGRLHVLCVEKVRRLIPVNPHAPQIITQQVEQRIPRQEAESIGDPVCLVGSIVIIGLVPFSQFPDGLCPLVIGPRPYPQSDTIERVRGVLLKDECVMNAMWLRAAGANFDVVGEASLSSPIQISTSHLPPSRVTWLFEATRGDTGENIRDVPAWPHATILPFHCPVPTGGCFPESQGARIG